MPRRRMPRLPPRRPRQPRLPDQAMPDAIADSYERELVALAAEVRARFEREVMPRVLAELERRVDAGDAGLPNVRQLMQWADSAAFTRKAGRLVKARGEQLDLFNEGAVTEQLRTVVQFDVFDYVDVDTRRTVDRWTRENIELIKTIPQKYLQQCEGIIVDGYQRSRRAEFVARDLMERGDVSFARARFIATDQAFKLNAALTQARHEQLGSDHYIWRTSRDGRVRDEHAVLEGKRFAYSDPPEVGNPGEDFGCRCRGEPDINEILEKAGSERMTQMEPEPPRSIPERVAARPPRVERPEIIRRQRRPRKPPRTARTGPDATAPAPDNVIPMTPRTLPPRELEPVRRAQIADGDVLYARVGGKWSAVEVRGQDPSGAVWVKHQATGREGSVKTAGLRRRRRRPA